MASTFDHEPRSPRNTECQKAHLILCNARLASASFLESFEATRLQRKARGAPTDTEQDLLRAMLAFASAGLDSMVKQLIRDALPIVIDRDEGAALTFKRFVERRLRRGAELDVRLLADALCEGSPRQRLIEELINDLTSQSLQSVEQLFRAAASFGIASETICQDAKSLAKIFQARNQIAHEMDVDFTQRNRNRRPRRRDTMRDHTNEVFGICDALLSQVDNKLE